MASKSSFNFPYFPIYLAVKLINPSICSYAKVMKSNEVHYDPFATMDDNSIANDEAIARAMAESMASETSQHQYQQGDTSLLTSLRTSPQPHASSFAPATSSPFSSNPFAAASSHMAVVPCTIGNICNEMMIDTGAQTSVLSMPIVRQLGLINRLDRRYMGVAAGVGKAHILGKINNVICSFGVGHVEFPMDFIVLDINDSLVILGLDQMRKYKCMVDMERDKLIFGGAEGIEVDMLPAGQQHTNFRELSSGCTLM